MFGDRRKRRRQPAGLSGLGGSSQEHFGRAASLVNEGMKLVNATKGRDLPCRDAFLVYQELCRIASALLTEILGIIDGGQTGPREEILQEVLGALREHAATLGETLEGCLNEDGVIGMWTADSEPPPPPSPFRVIRGGKS